VSRGESEYLEFKTSTGSLADGIKTVCAMLNSPLPGYVLFGVTDRGESAARTSQRERSKTSPTNCEGSTHLLYPTSGRFLSKTVEPSSSSPSPAAPGSIDMTAGPTTGSDQPRV
jgi:hypothetical protein